MKKPDPASFRLLLVRSDGAVVRGAHGLERGVLVVAVSVLIFICVFVCVGMLVVTGCSGIGKEADLPAPKGPVPAAGMGGGKEIMSPQWSHDGKAILYLVRTGRDLAAEVWMVEAKDGGEQRLAGGLPWPGRAGWSPDDTVILYTVMTQPEADSAPEVRCFDRGRGEEKVLVSAAELAEIVGGYDPWRVHLWWSPGGERIALQLDMGGVDAHSDGIRSLAVVDRDGSGLHPVEGQILLGWQDDAGLLVLKTHQDYRYGRAYRYDLFLVDPDGGEPGRLVVGDGQISSIDLVSQSSDLRILSIGQTTSVDTGMSFREEGTGFLLYDAHSDSLASFKPDSGCPKHPAVSPGGDRVAFAANHEGNWGLYLWEAGAVTQIINDPANELYPAWSPKGDKLAFVCDSDGTEEIWVLDLSTGGMEQLTGR